MPAGGLVRAGRYLALAYGFIGSFLGGAFFGWLVDRWVGSAPWGVLVGSLLGIAGGFVHMVRMLRHLERLDARGRP